MLKAMLVGLVTCMIGVGITVFLAALLAQKHPELEETTLLGLTVGVPYLAFLAGLVPVALRAEKWPIPSRGPRLLAAFLVASFSGMAAYLTFATVSLVWGGESLPEAKRSLVYVVAHPSEIPKLNQRTEYLDRDKPPTEFEMTWPPFTVFSAVMGFTVAFIWSGRWDEI